MEPLIGFYLEGTPRLQGVSKIWILTFTVSSSSPLEYAVRVFLPIIREALRDEEYYFQQYGTSPHYHRDEILSNTWIGR